MNKIVKTTTKAACFWGAVLFSLICAAAPASAQTLPAPTGEVILTIDGKIGATNRDGAADFDLAMIEALARATIRTSTPWFSGPVEFEGALLSALMEKVQANGTELMVAALNDYQAPVPISDFEAFGTILAYKRDGQYMSIADNGPLFIVYPYDSSPQLSTQKYYSRSVWQVRRFTVR